MALRKTGNAHAPAATLIWKNFDISASDRAELLQQLIGRVICGDFSSAASIFCVRSLWPAHRSGGLVFRRFAACNHISGGEPAMKIDVGAAARAEWAVLGAARPAANRAGRRLVGPVVVGRRFGHLGV